MWAESRVHMDISKQKPLTVTTTHGTALSTVGGNISLLWCMPGTLGPALLLPQSLALALAQLLVKF